MIVKFLCNETPFYISAEQILHITTLALFLVRVESCFLVRRLSVLAYKIDIDNQNAPLEKPWFNFTVSVIDLRYSILFSLKPKNCCCCCSPNDFSFDATVCCQLKFLNIAESGRLPLHGWLFSPFTYPVMLPSCLIC